MYSKDRGFTRPPFEGQPSRARSGRVSVPLNYSGHAIVDGEERPLGVLRGTPPAAEDRAETPTPRFDDLPRVSELGGGIRHPVRAISASYEVTAPSAEEVEGGTPLLSPGHEPPAPSREAGGERPVGMGHRGLWSGHGPGVEELLLLGLILLLLWEGSDRSDFSDRGDLDETVILLGLILLLG